MKIVEIASKISTRIPCLWIDTIHPEDRDRVANAFTRWISGEQVSYHDVGAAAKLGILRQTLESKIKRLGIDARWFRSRQAD